VGVRGGVRSIAYRQQNAVLDFSTGVHCGLVTYSHPRRTHEAKPRVLRPADVVSLLPNCFVLIDEKVFIYIGNSLRLRVDLKQNQT
jgi:hypothetical protein